MEITLNVNVNAPALVDLLKTAIAAANANKPGTPKAPVTGAPPPFIAAQVEKQNAEAAAADVGTDDTKPAKRGKKDAPAPATPAAAPAEAAVGELKLANVRARLGDYSADKRYGMEGVMKLLASYNVQRISDLPKDKYAEFMKVIDDALAASADPLS